MIKTITFFVFLSIALQGSAQSDLIIGHIIKNDSTFSFEKINVYLFIGDSVIAKTNVDSSGVFILKDISPGIYTLAAHAKGYSKNRDDSFVVNKDTKGFVYLFYPPPCNPKSYDISCSYNDHYHIDQIIPIVYGIPTNEEKRKALKGLVFPGGLADSDCDPKYYCTIHKRRL